MQHMLFCAEDASALCEEQEVTDTAAGLMFINVAFCEVHTE
jgi:hypothetical protein